MADAAALNGDLDLFATERAGGVGKGLEWLSGAEGGEGLDWGGHGICGVGMDLVISTKSYRSRG
jgi:hypothetical protein